MPVRAMPVLFLFHKKGKPKEAKRMAAIKCSYMFKFLTRVLIKTVVSRMGTAPKKERASSCETQANILRFVERASQYIYLGI